MKATKTLPPGSYLYHTLDFSHNLKQIVFLNIGALILFIVFGWMFLRITILLRPGDTGFGPVQFTLGWVLALLGVYVAVLVLHELIHGLFFWLLTREKPLFGFKGFYAYAAAPDWYLPRNPYMIVGLAPLALITLIGLVFIPFVPAALLPFLLLALTANASGAIGDIITVAWLSTQPAAVLVCDSGDVFRVYKVAAE